MGHDVIAIGQHSLKTTSIEALAKDLSERWNATILYGYPDDWIDEKENMPSFEFVETGRIEKSSKDIYCLEDSYYFDRMHKPLFANSVCYKLYSRADYDKYNIEILRNSFYANTHFDSRWWNFCRYFNGEINTPEWDNYIFQYRKQVYAEVTKMDGKYAFYGDDQGDSAYLQEIGQDCEWNEIYKKLNDDFGDEFLHVSSFIANKKNAIKRDIWYKAYHDDFSDLI